jgi:hypothetical protein
MIETGTVQHDDRRQRRIEWTSAGGNKRLVALH